MISILALLARCNQHWLVRAGIIGTLLRTLPIVGLLTAKIPPLSVVVAIAGLLGAPIVFLNLAIGPLPILLTATATAWHVSKGITPALSISPGYQPLVIIPDGVNLSLHDGDFGAIEPGALVFPGALTYKANLWVMRFFLTEVFLAVQARRPGVKLYITGRTDGAPLEKLLPGDGVFITGYLDDVRPRVAQSTVHVVPMTVGGGTRLKILEAMALGTPVVSTSKGVEGLDVTPDEAILIADEPAEFADAVVCLLIDATLRAKSVVNGRQLVKERYSWAICTQELEQLLYQVVESGRD